MMYDSEDNVKKKWIKLINNFFKKKSLSWDNIFETGAGFNYKKMNDDLWLNAKTSRNIYKPLPSRKRSTSLPNIFG